MKIKMFANLICATLLSLMACFSATIALAETRDDTAVVIEQSKRTQRLLDDGDYEKALNSAKSAYELSVKTIGENNLNTAILGETYANLLGFTGSTLMATELYKKTIVVYADRYGDNSVKLVPAIFGLAKHSKTPEQAKHVKRALNIVRTQVPYDNLAYARAVFDAAEFLTNSRANNKVVKNILGEAIDIYRLEYGAWSEEMIYPLMLRGKLAAAYRNPKQAKRNFNRALYIADRYVSRRHQIAMLGEAGTALLEHSRSTSAKRYLEKAYDLSTETFGEENPRTGLAALELGRYYLTDEKFDPAERLLKRSLGTIEKNANYRGSQLTALSLLVELNESQGRRDEATPYCQAIGAISPWASTQDYRPIFQKRPEYPREAWRKWSRGHVVVEFTVDEYGFVQSPEVVESTGHETFIAASLKAVDSFRYAPAYKEGKPVSTQGVRNTFNFSPW